MQSHESIFLHNGKERVDTSSKGLERYAQFRYLGYSTIQQANWLCQKTLQGRYIVPSNSVYKINGKWDTKRLPKLQGDKDHEFEYDQQNCKSQTLCGRTGAHPVHPL